MRVTPVKYKVPRASSRSPAPLSTCIKLCLYVCTYSYSPIDLRLRTSRLLSQHTMQAVDSDDEECPELVPVPTATKIPVTIITGFLGRWGAMDALGSRPGAVWLVCRTKAKCLASGSPYTQMLDTQLWGLSPLHLCILVW